jgi:membrane-bound lytic murein transglycosylase D
MSDLKKWNRLRSNKAPLGRSLKIYVNDNTAIASTTKTTIKDSTATALASNANKNFKEEKVVSYKDVVKYYRVKKGDNLGEISNKYGVSVAEIKKWNKLKSNNIALGANLKIIKNERVVTTVRKEVKADKVETAVASNENNIEENNTTSDFYEVQKGDNLFSIAKKFNVSIEDLKKWNNLEDLNVQLGAKLALANKEEATLETPKTETKVVEHKVKKGEYLGTIAKKYNVTVAEIKEWNGLESNNVKLGETLIVSKKEVAVNEAKSTKNEDVAANERSEYKLYYVKKGDSLFSIAKKYPGVTISDIKKWNGIKNESLKPGMKLKINNG